MEERLKQRLVGAIVLVSLAVVFVPILFDFPRGGNETTSTTSITEVPERPQGRYGPPVTITLDAPQTPRLDAEVEREHERGASNDDGAEDRGVSSGAAVAGAAPGASGASAVSGASEPATPSEASPARSDRAAAGEPDGGSGRTQAVEAPAAGGWMIQLGSFAKSENALALRKRLQAGGYPAHVESGSSAQGEVSRVFVGPMPDRKQANAAAAKLRREMALEGIVVPDPGG